MYYRKYFSGEIGNLGNSIGSGATKQVMFGNNSYGYRSTILTPILCRAIVEVLKEIGFSEACCSLDPENPVTYGEIFPYGAETQGIQVFFGYSSLNFSIHTYIITALYPDADISASSGNGSSYQNQKHNSVLSGSSVPAKYRFYVTVKGDPTSFLNVTMGTYEAPDSEVFLFEFGRGEDCLGNLAVGYRIHNGALYFFDLDKRVYINQTSPTSSIASSGIAINIGDVIVAGCSPDTVALIPWRYEQLLGVTLNNCYCVPKSLTTAYTEQAFLINGEEYWLLMNGRILARCPTKLPIS